MIRSSCAFYPALLLLSATLPASQAWATCTLTDGVNILCELGGAVASVNQITVDGTSYSIDTGGAITAGNTTTSVYSGIIDAGRNGDTLILSNITILGEANRHPTAGGVAMPAALQNASIFGGAGADTIILTNVTTAGGVAGDAMGRGLPEGTAGNDRIIVNNSFIGGTIAMGNGAANDNDFVTINGNSTIVGGIGLFPLETGDDTITINNGTIGTNPDGLSIFAGLGEDRVGIFGGTVQSTIDMAGGADTLVIDPGGGASGAQWTFSTPNRETTSLRVNTTRFLGGGGDDVAFIYNSGPGVLAENAVWDSWQQVTLNNSQFNIADSSITQLRLTNNSTLYQRDGALRLYNQNGSSFPSFLDVDGTSRVDMQDGAVGDYIHVGGYRPSAGSVLAVDVDPTMRGYVAGASDYIRDTTATSHVYAPGSLIDVNLTGTPSLSGARRIVDDVDASNLNTDPGLNASVNASTNYLFVSDPSTGGRTFWLQDEGIGGVYLLWTTYINDQTLGSYLGGDTGAGLGRLTIASTESVGSVVADLTPGAMLNGSCATRKGYNIWSNLTSSKGEHGLTDISNATGSLGAEADLGSYAGLGCERFVVGGFLYTSAGEFSNPTVSSLQADDWGGGLYLRGAHESGFYASILGQIGRNDTDITNPFMGATASFDGTIYGVAGALGLKRPVNADTALDFRAYGSWARLDADPFTDSLGLIFSKLSSETIVLGAHAGIEHEMDERNRIMARIGVKWTDVDSSLTSTGMTTGLADSFVVGTGELGVSGKLTDSVDLSLAAFGEIGDDIHNIGGRARLMLRF